MITTFRLPDLGEGLPEAEIITWHVEEGQQVHTDELLVSVETAKAVVEVPSPVTGRIVRLHAAEGDMVETGAPLVDFEEAGQDDSGTVVGSMPSSDDVLVETARAGRRHVRQVAPKASPAARALAAELGVELAEIVPSGGAGQITPKDVRAHAEARTSGSDRGREAAHGAWGGGALRGPRRAMARSMSASGAQVVPCTVFDDADIEHWRDPRAITERLLRALVAGCRSEPALNGFFNAADECLEAAERVDIAMAVDTPDGLIVPVIRDAANKSLAELRTDIDRIKTSTAARSIQPQEMLDYTITLSNFGMMAGRYATPVIVPPTVAILGAGMLQRDLVPVLGGIEVHRRIPLSLTFDHRCITGGEACRFLGAVIEDLSYPE